MERTGCGSCSLFGCTRQTASDPVADNCPESCQSSDVAMPAAIVAFVVPLVVVYGIVILLEHLIGTVMSLTIGLMVAAIAVGSLRAVQAWQGSTGRASTGRSTRGGFVDVVTKG